MFYSPVQNTSSFSQKAVAFTQPEQPKQTKVWLRLAGIGAAVIGLLIVGQLGWQKNSPSSKVTPTDTPEALGQSTSSAEVLIGRSFGDILKERPNFNGWIAGVEDGSIVLMQPQNGSLSRIVSAANAWYGPISDLVWSPDHTKLAYLTLSADDAVALAKDASGYAKEHNLGNIPTPSSFPFGKVTILDVVTKQVIQTKVEVRNTPKSLLWLDGNSVATIGQTIIKYNLADDSTATLAGGGNTSIGEQLQSPLVYDATGQILYFTKVKQLEDGQTVRLMAALSLKTNELKELQALKTGMFEEVTTSQGVDLALSSDGKRVAIIDEQGLSYMTLSDNGVHSLPYRDDLAWLRQSVLGGLVWLSPNSVGFHSMAKDGSMVWGGWYIPLDTVGTLAKGSLDASWDVATGRLAVIEPDGQNVGIVTPNWNDTSKSQLQVIPLTWTQISW